MKKFLCVFVILKKYFGRNEGQQPSSSTIAVDHRTSRAGVGQSISAVDSEGSCSVQKNLCASVILMVFKDLSEWPHYVSHCVLTHCVWVSDKQWLFVTCKSIFLLQIQLTIHFCELLPLHYLLLLEIHQVRAKRYECWVYLSQGLCTHRTATLHLLTWGFLLLWLNCVTN